ncbi:MAG TPA: NAD(P)-binding domain-containing protein [Chitinophagaceae bacterium]|nr:NAD(P)-binding domain-containing protein [Chitinophagaceae bacterium]
MKIGILGTGMVGNTLGTALIAKGHEVKMGSRDAVNEKAIEWTKANGKNARPDHPVGRAFHGTFEDAAIFGDIIFNCTKGEHSLEALTAAGEQNLAGKILVDVANPLDFSKGMPPTLSLVNDTSLGETIQTVFPQTKVVKTLNTLNCTLMVDATKLANGDHNLFICGNDESAKHKVKELLNENFNWKIENIIDLGDITNSRGSEQLLPIWIRLWGALGTADFNFKIVR